MIRPKLQVALDVYDKDEAIQIVKEIANEIDVIEIGTILCLSEGMHAIRKMRTNFPDKTILADVRIVKAGSKIAEMAFEAGANWVTVMSYATEDTVDAVVKTAKKYNGDVQIELCEGWDYDLVRSLREKGIEQFIYHRSTEVVDQSSASWSAGELTLVDELTGMGCKLSVTGGIKATDIPRFEGKNLFIIIAGRAICQAENRQKAAQSYNEALGKIAR